MLTWISLLAVVPQIISMVTDLVKQFEVPGVSGADKKKAVMAVLEGALKGINQCGLAAPTTVILTVADFVLEAAVNMFNIIGVFTHKDPAPAAAK